MSPIASFGAPGSHLLLVILERLVSVRGGVVAYRDTDSSIIPARPMGAVTTTDTGETVHSLNWVDMDEVIHAFHTLSPGQVT
jgi:hypothetical protein